MRLATAFRSGERRADLFVGSTRLGDRMVRLDRLLVGSAPEPSRRTTPEPNPLALLNGEHQFVRGLGHLEELVETAIDDRGVDGLESDGIAWSMDQLVFAPPVRQPGKMLFIGQNYLDHAAEVAAESDSSDVAEPAFFLKAPICLTGHRATITPPFYEPLIDYEVELAVVMAKRTHRVSEAEALDHVAGYTVVNDLTARKTQIEEMRRGAVMFGKNFAEAAPMGPWLVPAESIPNPQDLDITCEIDGEVRQHGHTSKMRLSVAEVVAKASRIPLEPGDVIATGTPAGIGWTRPDRDAALLQPNQIVRSSVSKVGTLEFRMAQWVEGDDEP